MAGRLVDLASPTTILPLRLAVDSSIVIDWLLAHSPPSVASPRPTPNQLRAAQFVWRMQVERVVGLVTSSAINEVYHVVIKTRFRADLPNDQADLLARYPNVRRHGWEHLYKARSDLLKQFAPDLDRARRLMIANGLLFLQPEDLDDIPSGRTLDDEMIWAIGRYELDTSDAAILIEAQRAGITSIVTADGDLVRPRLDFDVYTWL